MAEARLGMVLVAVALFVPRPTFAQAPEPSPVLMAESEHPSPGQLAAFGARMVGTWEADDARHVFEWGVGQRLLKSASYWPTDEGWQLVSEGVWYWDPGAEVIRGRTIAVGMGIDLFEYTTRLEDTQINHEMVVYGDISGRFVERWTFEGDLYVWALEQDGVRIMGGSLRKVR